MPLIQVTTQAAKTVWQSPDGQRTIFEVQLEYNGKAVKAKTYSKAIATVGWSGEAETYEKVGQAGAETFVKQPQKAGGYSGGGYKGAPKDMFTMYLSYAKDLIVAMVETSGYEKKKFEELLKATIEGGKALYDARPGAEQAPANKVVEHVTEGITVEDINQVFGGDEGWSQDELPPLKP